MVGGNFGAAPYDPQHAGDYDYWVIEVSSYTATDLASTPPVTAVTSLHPDHLPWHGGVERYYRDKLSACSQPGAELTVANGDSDLLRERAGLLAPKVEWVSQDDEPGATWMDPLGLPGGHNRRNALIARRVLAALGNAADDRRRVDRSADAAALRRAADGFTPLPSRLPTVGTVDGVAFVDDSLSTNVLPTLAALDAFPGRRVALIVGGQDRGIDYAPLAAGVRGRTAPTLVLTLPDRGPRISGAFTSAVAPARAETARAEGRAGGTDCADWDAAVAAGLAWARPDGVVLLSPAAPSFGRFRDYRDRGDQFAAAMRACSPASLAGRLRQPLEPGPAGPATLAHELLHPLHPRVGLDGERVQQVERQIVARPLARLRLAGGVGLLEQVGQNVSGFRPARGVVASVGFCVFRQ